jgi:outer membrane protein assembly factor BamB
MNLPSARRTLQVIAVAAGVAATSVSSAIDPASTCEAMFPGLYYAWSPPLTNTVAGIASEPASDTFFASSKHPSTTFLAQGGAVFAIRNVADREGAAGSIRWTWPSASHPNAPVPVLPTHGKEVVFVTTAGGMVHKIADDGTTLASSDTRRFIGGTLACQAAPGDGIIATPAVQLYGVADNAFQSALNAAKHRHDDLVFVITADGCGDTTSNRVIAFWASDLTVAWTFNADRFERVDRGSACIVDYATNTLFCGTDLAAGAPLSQSSLFALDTATGQLKWSQNAGALLNRPVLAGGRLYVASKPGTLQAYDPNGDGVGRGRALWASALFVATPGSIIASNVAPYVLGSQVSLLLVDTSGVLRVIRDNGSSGAIQWNLVADPGALFSTAPLAAPALGKIYIGRDDGYVQQIGVFPFGFVPEGVVTVDADTDMGDLALDADPGSTVLNRLVVAGDRGKATRLNLPICNIQPIP